MVSSAASIVSGLLAAERTSRRGIHLVPSENTLSPLARLPFVLDAYSRYFLDDLRQYGMWSFPAGRALGKIEQEVVEPLLADLARASHVNVRPLSGLSGMTVVLAALTRPGDRVLTVPMEAGGHVSTRVVAERLGLRVEALAMRDAFEVDLDAFAAQAAELQPTWVYLDQSSLLFQIDPQPLREVLDTVSPATRIHQDASHTNGLILGGALFNPLDRGATSFGGSTHKTLPGPHKAFFASRDAEVADRLQATTDHFISHHHPADVLSLAFVLLELRDCGGELYANRTIENALALARALDARGIHVAAKERGFTACHQVWAAVPEGIDSDAVADRLTRAGVFTNHFGGLPSLPRRAFRLSVAEVTRLGARAEQMSVLAGILADAMTAKADARALSERVRSLRANLDRPRYCFPVSEVLERDAADAADESAFWVLLRALESIASAS